MGKGISSISDALGLGGKQESYFQNQNVTANPYLVQTPGQSTAYQQALAAQNPNGDAYTQAQGQVAGGPLGQSYGAGGLMDQTAQQEHQQASQPWALTPEDQSAYGQASGNIARMFGSAQNGVSQSMADRGLAAGGSGQAAQQFSGLQGNQMEQLGQLQTNIANNRQQMNMQRLGQTQQFMNQLNSGYNSAMQGQQNANMGQQSQNRESNQANIQDQMGAYGQQLDANKQNMQANYQNNQNAIGAANANNKSGLESTQNQQDNKQSTFGDFLGAGIGQGLQGGAKSFTSGIFTNSQQAGKAAMMAKGGLVRPDQGEDDGSKDSGGSGGMSSLMSSMMDSGAAGAAMSKGGLIAPSGTSSIAEPDPKAAAAMQAGAMQDGTDNMSNWADNFKHAFDSDPATPMASGGPVGMPGAGEPQSISNWGLVPGSPKVKGDSYMNDFIPAKLSPGEIVLPRSVAQAPNAPAEASKFVQQTLKKKR